VIADQHESWSAPRAESPERSGGRSARGADPDPEVLARSKRRRFTAEYKARIVAEAERMRAAGEIGAMLRREGLFSSQLAAGRAGLARHGVEGLAARKRGPAPKPKPSTREVQLEREKRKLEKDLAKAKAIIAFQKKVHELLGIPLKNHELEEDD
jgi:transposase-like protein